MDLVGKAKRVRIYVGEDQKIGHRPADEALVALLRREGAQGVTVFRGVSGFGATGEIHVSHLVDVVQHLPLVVEWIDSDEVVDRLLPRVKQLLKSGLVTVDATEIVLYQPHPVRALSATLTAGEVMSREVATVAKDTPVRQVVELMLGKVYRAVPVVEDGRPVGIVTHGDLVRKGGLAVRLDLVACLEEPERRALLERLGSGSKVAADVMTPSPVTVEAGTPLPRVAELMSHGRLKRLPVVDARGALAGMVSRVDLLRTAAAGTTRRDTAARELGLTGDAPLARVMRRDVPTVRPDTPLPEVFQAIVATRLNRVLVVDADRRVLGLVTDAELLDRLTPALRSGALRSLMHRLPFGHAASG
ncbi:MAG TPA: DUF190 domain-containing protein, partial [Longimicrobium sp.]|nr:DUF190 domain-containing protein [Longimicrobium sp.]